MRLSQTQKNYLYDQLVKRSIYFKQLADTSLLDQLVEEIKDATIPKEILKVNPDYIKTARVYIAVGDWIWSKVRIPHKETGSVNIDALGYPVHGVNKVVAHYQVLAEKQAKFKQNLMNLLNSINTYKQLEKELPEAYTLLDVAKPDIRKEIC